MKAHPRKDRGAIGARGKENVPQMSDVKTEDDEEEGKKDVESQVFRRRKDCNIEKKSKYSDSTLPVSSEMTRNKVIDMTGAEQRILSGYHAGRNQQCLDETVVTSGKKSKINFALPELQQNLNLLVDTCEQDIIQNDSQMKYLNDRVVTLEAVKKNLSKIMNQYVQRRNALKNILTILEELSTKTNEMSLQEIAQAFKNLQKNYYEYHKNELCELTSSFVTHKIKNCLLSWNPLKRPKETIKLFKQWKDILENGIGTTTQIQTMRPYDQLVWNAWMPSVRGAIQYVYKLYL